MTNKEKYRQLCETEGSSIPLFLQYWWMEAVCEGKQWDVALCQEEGASGIISAAWPYVVGRRWGMTYLLQPQLTQYCGPWLRSGSAASATQRTELLLQQLRRHRPTYHNQHLAPGFEALSPLKQSRYTLTPRYTYRLADLSDLETLYHHFAKSRQRQIRRASESLHVTPSVTPQQFAQFHADYWKSRGKRDLLSQPFITRVVTATLQRGQGLLLGLADADEKLMAARFVAFDDRMAYSLLSALTPSPRPNGTSALLTWEMMQRLASRTQGFDFEGGMEEGVGFNYSLFGAQQIPYTQITRCDNPLVAWLLRHRS